MQRWVVATGDGDRVFWQFVRGYAFYWGLEPHEWVDD